MATSRPTVDQEEGIPDQIKDGEPQGEGAASPGPQGSSESSENVQSSDSLVPTLTSEGGPGIDDEEKLLKRTDPSKRGEPQGEEAASPEGLLEPESSIDSQPSASPIATHTSGGGPILDAAEDLPLDSQQGNLIVGGQNSPEKSQLSGNPEPAVDTGGAVPSDDAVEQPELRSSHPREERDEDLHGTPDSTMDEPPAGSTIDKENEWKRPAKLDIEWLAVYGSNSKERDTQAKREGTVLQELFFTAAMIPDTPKEPDLEAVEYVEPKRIPLDDQTLDKDMQDEDESQDLGLEQRSNSTEGAVAAAGNVAQENQRQGPAVQPKIVPLAVLLLAVALVVKGLMSAPAQSEPPASMPYCDCSGKNDSCTDFLRDRVAALQEKYPTQDPTLWIMLNSAAYEHAACRLNPVRPITILAYHRNDVDIGPVLTDIADLYDDLLSGGRWRGNMSIDGSDYVIHEPETVQRHLVTQLERGFKQGIKVAVVRNFHDLPTCSVLTFHNYCNNEDAPYTDVAIILTVTGEEALEEEGRWRPKKMEEFVGRILHERWRDCPEDMPPGKVDAILSRVANNVVMIK